jgi:hypothetical protein
VLWRIFLPKRDEVTGGWRKLNNEELHNLYSSPSIILIFKSVRVKWAWNVARMGRLEMQDFGGKPVGKRQLGRFTCRWENTIKMDLRGI